MRDVVNQFIWSGFQYYLRQPTDCYILLSPAKCYKSLGLLNYKYGGGYLFNREHFHAGAASIMCTLWFNETENHNKIEVSAYNINKDNKIEFIKDVEIKKVFKTLNALYDSKKRKGDIPTSVWCEYSGIETSGRKTDSTPVFNEDIIAYLRSDGFTIAPLATHLTRQMTYNARGMYLRKDNVLNKLPLLVSKLYPMKNWYDKEVLMTSSDGGTEFENDKEFLKQCFIYACLTNANKCFSFDGSDGNYYRNELCLDNGTFARDLINKYRENEELSNVEEKLIEQYEKILNEIKKVQDNKYMYEEYNPKYSYGVAQIQKTINIKEEDKDEAGNIIYERNSKGEMTPKMVDKYGKNLSNLITPLQTALDEYYLKFIKPKMIMYQLVK